MKTILHLLAETIRFLALVGGLICALGAMGALGGALSDRLDVLTHFTPVWLTGALLAMAARLATGGGPGRAPLALCLLAVVACALLMAPDIVEALSQKRLAAEPGDLKVIQFNLWNLNVAPAATADWIIAQDADVVVLEEAYPSAVIPLLKAHYPHQTSCNPPYPCSTMILSKAPYAAAGGVEDDSSARKLAAAWARFGAGPAAFTVVGAHYTWPIPAGPQQAQTRRLATFVNGLDRPSLILTGDFNSTPWSFSLHRQDRLFGLERRTRAVFSWPTSHFTRYRLWLPLPFLAIDHIYAGSQWKTVSITRGPMLGSDHYPVVAVFRRELPGA